MIEYLDFFFLIEDPLFSFFHDNKKMFKKYFIGKEESLTKKYYLNQPVMICKDCFTNRLHDKEGIKKLFSIFSVSENEDNSYETNSSKNKHIENNESLRTSLSKGDHSSQPRKLSLDIQKRESKSNLSLGASQKSKQADITEITKSNSVKSTSQSKSKKSAKKIVMENNYSDFLRVKEHKGISILPPFKGSTSILSQPEIKVIPKPSVNDNEEASEMDLELIEKNIEELSSQLSKQLGVFNDKDKELQIKKSDIVNKINSLHSDLRNKTHAFQALCNLKSNVISSTLKNISIMLSLLQKNIRIKYRQNNDKSFENLLAKKNDVLLIRKVNIIIEEIISTFFHSIKAMTGKSA
eukprot:CAMPEP_0170523264 /NCGR_PEP_ID=MMETSP0209-20121228/8711_1 /TAXON_ID=665100 ORGANISM="Litonotus pictus, Strain P1" /NCGR_SAMPLE_ID=MMETSP0209 /ASSEMBLY_ACC=CAM_ASM_000301 /LENGTH=351 /DNA_ID=CAMNT_0010811279 /DNA_START=574 /DNA_END=1625 /DNA_ORIENTATION=+